MVKIVLFLAILCCNFSFLLAQSINNALRLDGIDDYISLDLLAPILANTPNFTVEFWVKTDFNNNTVQPRVNLFTINPAAPAQNKFALVMGNTTAVQSGNLSVYESVGPIYLTSTQLLGDNICHHVAYVRTGNSGETFFDGESIGVLPVLSPLASDDRISIGQDWDNLAASDFLNGDLDEFRIWSYARNSSEIKNNMNRKMKGSEVGLLVYYNFDQGIDGANNTAIKTVIDLSSNQQNGQLNNFALTGNTSNWIKANFAPEFNLGNDSTLCGNNPLSLTGTNAVGYQWSTGSVSQSIFVPTSGVYWLEENNGACASRDSIFINFIPILNSGNEKDTFCIGTDFNLLGYESSVTSYLWNDLSTLSHLSINQSGLYTVDRINLCGISQLSFDVITQDCSCHIYAPNSFTPNDDEINQVFRVVYNCEIQDFTLQIFNRWGELIFESFDPEIGWDGTFGGKMVQHGLYIYKFQYKNFLEEDLKQFVGHVQIIE